MNLITATDLCKSYAQHVALNNLTLEIPEGSIFGLLGPNGAGKTTLIRILTRILYPDSGILLFKGQPLKDSHIRSIGYLPEERGLYKKMKVEEQLIYLARLKDLSRTDAKKRAKHWLQKLDLEKWNSHSVAELSKGMQQKVQFIASIIHDPEMIIFDEPFSGFDPVNSRIITEEILELKNKGCTILFSTHRMETVESLCDHIALVHQGKNILYGNIKTVKDSFRKNIFKVEIQGALPQKASFFDIESIETKSENHLAARISLESGIDSNRLLSELMQTAHILSFQEEIPSVNDIFLSYIQKDVNNE